MSVEVCEKKKLKNSNKAVIDCKAGERKGFTESRMQLRFTLWHLKHTLAFHQSIYGKFPSRFLLKLIA